MLIAIAGPYSAETTEQRRHNLDALNMAISLTLVDQCEAILVIGESPGAKREQELIRSKGLPIYTDVADIPMGSASQSPQRVT